MPTLFKEKKEPSVSIALIYAAMMSFFGVIVGMVYLMSLPLQGFSSMAERAKAREERNSLDPVPTDAFYLEGPVLQTSSWEAKRNRLINGGAGVLEISPGEINAWFASKFQPSSGPPAKNEEGILIVPGQPNVAVSEEGVFFVNLPAQVSGYGMNAEYVLSAIGGYSSGAPAVFKIDQLKIGSAKMPLPDLLGSQIIDVLTQSYKQTKEYKTILSAWERVDSVEFSGSSLRLKLL